jgi:hypothetical protein
MLVMISETWKKGVSCRRSGENEQENASEDYGDQELSEI